MKPAPEKSPAAILRAKAEAQVKKTDAACPPQSEVEVRRLQHELEVHQIELEMQNEGLRAAQAETALALEQFTELYDFAPAGYFTLTADGTIRQLNLTGAQFLGAARSHLIGASFRLLAGEGDRKTFSHFLAQVFGSPEIQHLRLPLQPKNRPPLIARLEARRDAAGTRCRLVMLDVTAQVQAERLAAETLALNQSILAGIPNAMEIVDLTGNILYQNEAMIKAVDRPVLGQKCWEVYADNRQQCAHCPLKQPLGIGELKTTEVGGVLGGRTFEIHHVGIEYQGRPAVMELFHDITERQRAELLLRDQERQYRDLFESASDALLLLDESGRVLDANQMAMQFYGYERDEFLTKKNVDLSAEPEETGRRTLEAVTKSDQVFFIPHRLHRRKNGTVFSVEITCRTLIRNGRTVLLVACRDITERKQMETALVETQKNLITLVNSMPDNVIFKDGAGRWLVANPPAIEFFQLKGVTWIGKTDAELALERPLLKDLFAGCTRSDEAGWASGGLTRVTEGGPGPDGKMQEHEVHKVPLFNADGSRHALLVVGRDVTEKRRLEDALRLSELMASQSRDALLLVRNRDGRIISANAAAVEFYGYTREELLAKTIYDLRQNNDVALAAHQLSQAFASGILFETVHVHKDGHTIPVEVSAHGADFEGEGFLVSSIRDITARKNAESKLLQLEQSIAAAANGIFLVKPNGQIFWVNAAFTQMTGYSAEEAIGKNPRFLKSGQHDTGFYRELWQTILAGKVWQAEIFNRRKDGTIYPENKTITPVIGADGKLSHFICVQEDITEKKRVAEALRDSHERFRRLIESTNDWVWEVNAQGEYTYASAKVKEILGYEPADLIGRTPFDLMPTDEAVRVGALFGEIAVTRKPFNCLENINRHKDGRTVILESSGVPFYNAQGELLGYRGVDRDITARRLAENALTKANIELEQRVVERTREIAMLSEVIDQSTVGFSMSNPDGNFITVNESYARLTGYTRDEILGNKLNWNKELTPPEWRPIGAEKMEECLRTRQTVHFEKEYLRKDGSRVPVEVFVQPIYGSDGKFLHLRAFVTDITERNKIAKALELAWKLASEASRAKSEFLANMSHEIRTPLNAILGFTQLLRQDASLPEPVLKKLQIISKSGDNLLNILNDILDLAKIEAGRMTVQLVEFSCAGMLAEIVQLFRPPAEAKQLSLSLVKVGEIPHLVRADGEKIRRVLTNLLGNAVKFTQAGGIEVTATIISGGEGQPPQLHVAVKDTGPGLTSMEISQLFKKFEQASAGRASLVGTGLGLAICQQYAELLGGKISVQSQAGRGSTFVFEVPIEPAVDAGNTQPDFPVFAVRLVPGQPECRVLVVDDMEDNRAFMLEILRRSGFACRSAASGAEALAGAAEWQPHLVLMDTRMPEMDGLETIRRLRARPGSSDLKIISLSATAFAEDREAALTAGADEFASKPVQSPELLGKIGRLLNLSYVPIALEPAAAVAAPFPVWADTVAALARLPESWRHQLRDDLLVADFNRVEEAVKNIQPQHPALAAALSQLVGQFDAESILNLLADAATRRT